MKLRYESLNGKMKEVNVIKKLGRFRWKVETPSGPRVWYGEENLFTYKQTYRGTSQRRVSWFGPEEITE